MSTHRSASPEAASLEAADVMSYLKEHPDFFEQYPQILALMRVTHAGTGGAVSLIERQVAVLRDQNRSLERKLIELVQIARANEQLSRQLHDFASELLGTKSLSDVIAVAQDKIRELFNTDFVALRLLDDVSDDFAIAMDEESLEALFDELLNNNKPVCGRLRAQQSEFLFAGNAGEIKSAALIPLHAAGPLGLLALASRNPQQFNPTMGGLFLSHLGDLVSSALSVHVRQ
ncbi:MAG TPA: DUF484 family protein [Gammaproteobacteria bacterium]|nr:DUF484 family protein [Gammaproteobacteria bacterium]